MQNLVGLATKLAVKNFENFQVHHLQRIRPSKPQDEDSHLLLL